MADSTLLLTLKVDDQASKGINSILDSIGEKIKSVSKGVGEAVSPNAPTAAPQGKEGSKPEGSSKEGKKDAEEFGKSIETANKGLEVLTKSTEAFGRILTTGRLNVAVGGFNQIGESVKSVASEFGEAGSKIGLVATGITAAFAAVAGGIVTVKELGDHAAEDVNRFNELKDVAGLTGNQFAALQTNFAQFGVGLETVQRLVRLTSVRIQEEWGSLVHSVKTANDDLAKEQLNVSSATRRQEEAESRERLAPFGEVQAQENLLEAQARQSFAPHGVAHAEARLEESQLAIPEADLTADEAHTNLAEAQMRWRKFFDTHDLPAAGTQDRINWEREQQHLQRAELAAKHAEIRDTEAKQTEGGIPEAQEALRKANFEQAQAAPHAVDEAQEGLLEAKRKEAEASDEVAKAAIAAREALLSLQEFPLKNAPALAAAIGAGGGGIDFSQVSGADLFRAVTLRGGTNAETGAPDLQGVIKAVSEFYNLPGVPSTAKASLGAEITGGRGADLPQAIAALTEMFNRKEGIFTETDRSRSLASSVAANTPKSEELRTTEANKGIDVEKAIIDFGGKLIDVAERVDKGEASAIQNLAQGASEAYDKFNEGAQKLTGAFDSINTFAGITVDAAGKVKQSGDSLSNAFDGLKSIVTGLSSVIQKVNANAGGGTKETIGTPTQAERDQAAKTANPFAEGGWVEGPGSGTSDSIPAMVSHGEYIVKADSAQNMERKRPGFLDALNERRVHFADGGAIDDTDDGDFHSRSYDRVPSSAHVEWRGRSSPAVMWASNFISPLLNQMRHYGAFSSATPESRKWLQSNLPEHLPTEPIFDPSNPARLDLVAPGVTLREFGGQTIPQYARIDGSRYESSYAGFAEGGIIVPRDDKKKQEPSVPPDMWRGPEDFMFGPDGCEPGTGHAGSIYVSRGGFLHFDQGGNVSYGDAGYETIDERDKRITEAIKANYAENLDVALESGPRPTGQPEPSIRARGQFTNIAPDEGMWAGDNFARARALSRDADARRAAGMPLAPLGDAGNVGSPVGNTETGPIGHFKVGDFEGSFIEDRSEGKQRRRLETDSTPAMGHFKVGDFDGSFIEDRDQGKQRPRLETAFDYLSNTGGVNYRRMWESFGETPHPRHQHHHHRRDEFAEGGSVGNLISAFLSNGEYRMSPESTQHYGVGLFDKINAGGFADGGMVDTDAMFDSHFYRPSFDPQDSSASATSGARYTLDLRTDRGNFSATVDKNELDNMRRAAVMAKLTNSGSPAWRT